jgi:hypothetical protein
MATPFDRAKPHPSAIARMGHKLYQVLGSFDGGGSYIIRSRVTKKVAYTEKWRWEQEPWYDRVWVQRMR